MKISIKNIILIVLCLAMFYTEIFASSDIRKSAKYSADYNNLFYFIQVSDVHVGKEDKYKDKDVERFKELFTVLKSNINPAFIVNTGDLIDATNSADYMQYQFAFWKLPWGEYPPNVQQPDEWIKYENILKENNIDSASNYYDVVGNHERYNDKGWNGTYDEITKKFYGYKQSTLYGSTSNPIGQFTWTKTLTNGDNYLFMAVNTCDEMGLGYGEYFSRHEEFGYVSDAPTLSEVERDYIKEKLEK